MSNLFFAYRPKIIAAICLLLCIIHLNAQDKKPMTLWFGNVVGDKALHLDTAKYKNSLGQDFTVTNFKYYISHITLIDSTGKEFEQKDGYYLINESDPDSHEIVLNEVPQAKYAKIAFTVGVDSIHNCSGAQSGALDPINGMFWTWNTGYIFLKLEGKAPASKQPGHIFEYHIGGYKEPTNCIRRVVLDIGTYAKDEVRDERDSNVNKIPGSDTPVKQIIYITADIDKLLHGPTIIDFSKLSSVTDFHHSPEVADNYKSMFRIDHVVYGY